MKAMVEAATDDPYAAQRVNMFRYRALEEFYDLKHDPDCIHNLIDQPEYKNEVERMRRQLKEWMKQTHDFLLPAFDDRHSPEKLKSILTDLYGDNYTKAGKKKKKKKQADKKKNKKMELDVIAQTRGVQEKSRVFTATKNASESDTIV
jgi:hypothetical protein